MEDVYNALKMYEAGSVSRDEARDYIFTELEKMLAIVGMGDEARDHDPDNLLVDAGNLVEHNDFNRFIDAGLLTPEDCKPVYLKYLDMLAADRFREFERILYMIETGMVLNPAEFKPFVMKVFRTNVDHLFKLHQLGVCDDEDLNSGSLAYLKEHPGELADFVDAELISLQQAKRLAKDVDFTDYGQDLVILYFQQGIISRQQARKCLLTGGAGLVDDIEDWYDWGLISINDAKKLLLPIAAQELLSKDFAEALIG